MYCIISSIEYGKGRILLMCCRFNNFFYTTPLNDKFSRRCIEWASSSKASDTIDVYSLFQNNVDGTIGDISKIDNINNYHINISDLSNHGFLRDQSILLFGGIDNSISPLVRKNILEYVKNGNGLIAYDINITEDYINLFDEVSPVYCESSGVNLNSGAGEWVLNFNHLQFFNSSFENMNISPLNTISLGRMGDEWEHVYIYNTSVEEVVSPLLPPPSLINTDNISSDYDLFGDNIIGYYASVYKNGFFSLKK